MARRRSKPVFTVGQEVRTKYYTPGVPTGISAESRVKIIDVAVFKAPELPRYRISHSGGMSLWVYEDVLEPLGGGA